MKTPFLQPWHALLAIMAGIVSREHSQGPRGVLAEISLWSRSKLRRATNFTVGRICSPFAIGLFPK
jgi:hypothetical protein